ncbi:MAG: hypothetical protein WDM79_13945 [Terricaulis sp.]
MAVDASTPPLVRVRRRWRTAIGLALAPIAAGMFATSALYLIVSAASQAWQPLTQLGMMCVGLSAIALALMIVFGWPFHAIAYRKRWTTAPTYIGAGAALGFVAMGVLMALYFQQNPGAVGETEVAGFVIGIVIALSLFAMLPCTLMAWLFWLIRRPDRDPPPAAHFIFD